MDAGTTFFVTYSLYEMPSTLLKRFFSAVWIFLRSSAVSVYVLHAHRKIDMTNACSSFSLDDRLMFLSVPMHFSFASAAAVCAVLAKTLIFEPFSLRIALRYLNWFSVESLSTDCDLRKLYVLCAVWRQLCLFSTNLHAVSGRHFVQAPHQIGKFLFFSLQPVNVVSEPKVCDDRETNSDCVMMLFKDTCHYALKEDVEQGRWQEAALADPDWCVEPVVHCSLHKYCTPGFWVILFDGVIQLLVHVALLHRGP